MSVRPATFAALAALALAAPPGLALAQEQELPARTISVSGTGEAQAAPEEAVLRLGVTVREETAGAAAEAARERAAAVVAALTPELVAEADLRTANISLQPVYGDGYELRREGEGPRIVAYEARRDYEARAPLARLGAVIDAAVEAGANEIGGVTLQISDPEPLATEARREAFAAARAKAETLAEAAGARLGEAVRIAEGAPLDPGPVPMMRMAMESADAIAPGELTVSVTVSVVFALEAAE